MVCKLCYLFLDENVTEPGAVPRNYGHAAAAAFAAYKNPKFLDYAEQVWWAAKAYTLSQNDVSVGTTPLKESTLSPTCHGRKSLR